MHTTSRASAKTMAYEEFDRNDPCMIKILKDPFTVLEADDGNNSIWPKCSYCKKWMINSSHLTSDKHLSALYWARVSPGWLATHQRKHNCLIQPRAVQQPTAQPPRVASASSAADDVDWPPQHALEESQSQDPAPSGREIQGAIRRWSRPATPAPVVIDISTDSDDDKQNSNDMAIQTTMLTNDREIQTSIETQDMQIQTRPEQTEDEQTEDKQDKGMQPDNSNKMPPNTEVSTCEQSTQISTGARARLPPILGTQTTPTLSEARAWQ